jgi:hypothetical protein
MRLWSTQIRTDESLQVLVFVVLPLLLLLITAIFLWVRYTPPSTAKFPTFSVSLSRVGREDAYIVYRDSDRRLEFYVGPGERTQVLSLQVPEELPDQDIRDFVQKLSMGLAKMGFLKYKIIKTGDNTVIARGPRNKDGDNPG